MENEGNLDKDNGLPETKFFFKTQEEVAIWWNMAWKRYLQTLEEEGSMVNIDGDLVDRNDLIPTEFLHKKCDI